MQVHLLPFEEEKMKDVLRYFDTEDTPENRARLLITLLIEKHEFLSERFRKTSPRKHKMTKTINNKIERLEKISFLLRENPEWTLKDLRTAIGSTDMTIRSDLKELGREDLISGGHHKRWSEERQARHKRILELVSEGMWFVDDFANAIGVHRRTMQKDLSELGLEDLLKRSRAEMYRRMGDKRKSGSNPMK